MLSKVDVMLFNKEYNRVELIRALMVQILLGKYIIIFDKIIIIIYFSLKKKKLIYISDNILLFCDFQLRDETYGHYFNETGK